MCLRPRACTRYLPRLLTVLVFFAVAGTLVLANLSDEMSQRAKIPAALLDVPSFDLAEPDQTDAQKWTSPSFSNLSYGWPLLWNQYVCAFTGGPSGITGWCYSATRLTVDIAAWLVMLAVPTAACEWLLRRYRPRLRWTLRTMLTAVGLFAGVCAWFDTARKRVELQEPIIATGTRVWVERLGPRWFEIVGVDSLFRRIIGADLEYLLEDDATVEGLLQQLEGLRNLQYLSFEVPKLTPSIAAALGEMRQLRVLSISVDELTPDMGTSLAVALGGMPQLRVLSIKDANSAYEQDARQVWHECLAAIGNATQLRSVWLDGGALDSKSLGCLAELTNLEMLSIDIDISIDQPAKPESDQSPLEHLSPLPQLTTLDLASFDVDDDDLGRLAILPSLKSLSLRSTRATCAGLSELGALQAVEELAIDNDLATAEAFDALRAVKGLKILHVMPASFTERRLTGNIMLDDGGKLRVLEEQLSAIVSAIDALRLSNPGITIKMGEIALDSQDGLVMSSKFEEFPDPTLTLGRRYLRAWKAGKGNFSQSPRIK